MGNHLLFAGLLTLVACSDSGAGSGGSASTKTTTTGKTASARTARPSASAPPSASASAPTSASATASASASAVVPEPDKTSVTLKTDKGDVVLHSVHHGTVYLEVDKKIVWIDPFSEGKLDDAPKADFILITHDHPDHLDEKALAIVKKEGTKIVGPQSVADKLPGTEVIANGAKKTLGPIEVEAVPAYNEKRGPEAGKLFHDKGKGNGYIVSFGKKRIYFSGDTECVPEIKALKDIDVAFFCMNLPYTMTPEEAGECVAAFKPKMLIPYHYRGQDPSKLDAKAKEAGVTVERLRFY